MKIKSKSNKSYSKRLKVTRRGKVLSRIPGQNHFNARARRAKQLQQKGLVGFRIPKKTLKHYLPNAKI